MVADEPQTKHGFVVDQVISALQKEIRRGHIENAALLAYELLITSPVLEDILWSRLIVIAVEDIGFGDVQAPVLISTLQDTAAKLDRDSWDHKVMAIHAVRYLCTRQKDRTSSELLDWIIHAVSAGKAKPSIPDYALDYHTKRGVELGRGKQHFWEEGTQLHPELPERDLTYRERVLFMLERGEIED